MQDNKVEDLLKQQVNEIMDEQQPAATQEKEIYSKPRKKKNVKRKKHKALKVAGGIAAVLLAVIIFFIGTKPGRRILYRTASHYIYSNMHNEKLVKEYQKGNNAQSSDMRQEDYVTNYLIFGIEEFGGARNTDSMMIASINTKDNTIKLTSLLRDSYVEIPGHSANKLNAAYSRGGATMLINTIEQNYKIKIDGYASVDFKSFEKIVDLLGGVTIKLGKEEAEYLNTTNYISKKSNRHVKAGVNKLNGNQVMGYCRVRKVKTLGGINNDYGRVVRQQRALKAIFKSYISPKNLFKIPGITKKCLGYVTTSLTEDQIEKAIEDICENRITTMKTCRIPVDGEFDAPIRYNGIGYPIILDWDANRIELFKFIFNDTEKEAKAALASLK